MISVRRRYFFMAQNRKTDSPILVFSVGLAIVILQRGSESWLVSVRKSRPRI